LNCLAAISSSSGSDFFALLVLTALVLFVVDRLEAAAKLGIVFVGIGLSFDGNFFFGVILNAGFCVSGGDGAGGVFSFGFAFGCSSFLGSGSGSGCFSIGGVGGGGVFSFGSSLTGSCGAGSGWDGADCDGFIGNAFFVGGLNRLICSWLSLGRCLGFSALVGNEFFLSLFIFCFASWSSFCFTSAIFISGIWVNGSCACFNCGSLVFVLLLLSGCDGCAAVDGAGTGFNGAVLGILVASL